MQSIPNAASIIKSIQRLTITITGTNAGGTGNLSTAVNATKCAILVLGWNVPNAAAAITDAGALSASVDFTTPTGTAETEITASRTGPTNGMSTSVKVMVIEFFLVNGT